MAGSKLSRETQDQIDALRAQIRKIAFDANLVDKMGITGYEYGERCSKKRKRLLKAIAKLEGEAQPTAPTASPSNPRRTPKTEQMELFA